MALSNLELEFRPEDNFLSSAMISYNLELFRLSFFI